MSKSEYIKREQELHDKWDKFCLNRARYMSKGNIKNIKFLDDLELDFNKARDKLIKDIKGTEYE